ncbi:polysaccharide deacetylase [Neorhizobium lilium]|uniref:Chitooligosaccharide deacetylase n=1 Tax=Neorhizobium lilium TaxID=2503024 RepID=A0A3S3VHS3_9HYPH|nr:polysaccharide deacetylase family protein [Neorhizobium lilium]RWX76937.1 polysaccharide deacetylase [Neorhizobium lilium]
MRIQIIIAGAVALSLPAAVNAAQLATAPLVPVTTPATAPVAPSILPSHASAHLPKLVEPQLHIARAGNGSPARIALTFDACMGKADERILSTLLRERVPATIFVTARWLRTNPAAVAIFRDNPDLFEIEDHGENHIPAVDFQTSIYGIAAAGSPEAVGREVGRGADAIRAAGLPEPRWFRGATAKYDLTAIHEIRNMGFRIAGYSVNGDGGSLLGAQETLKHIGSAKDGDVVISHINQPTHAAGEGVAKAILALKARGVEFVRLSDVEATGDNDTTGRQPGMF